MAYTYEDVTPTLVENTTMKMRLLHGMPRTYLITPSEGYVLHDANYDTWVDADLNALTEPILGYRSTSATCPADYDFKENPRKFYAVPEEVQA